MSREITHDEDGPLQIDTDEHDGDIFLCQCGLSDDLPFCDGSHTVAVDEKEGVTYKYENDDSDGPRHPIASIEYADE